MSTALIEQIKDDLGSSLLDTKGGTYFTLAGGNLLTIHTTGGHAWEVRGEDMIDFGTEGFLTILGRSGSRHVQWANVVAVDVSP